MEWPTAIFADDTALLATGNNVDTATNSLQIAVNNANRCTKNGVLNWMRQKSILIYT